MVEPDFPEDAITISVSDGMGVLYSDDNIEIPQWMFSTESVHAKRMNCNLPLVSWSITVLCCMLNLSLHIFSSSVFVLRHVWLLLYCKHGREAV